MTEPRIVLNGARLEQLVLRAPGTVDVALRDARVHVPTPSGDAEWIFEAAIRFTGVTRIDARGSGAGDASGALLVEGDTLHEATIVLAADAGGDGEIASTIETGLELRVTRAELSLASSGATLTVHAAAATVTLGRGHRVSEAPGSPPANG